MGGEKLRAGSTARPKGGSPPRGRGKDLVRFYPLCFPGITPAWAGKSFSFVHPLLAQWDHPRVGGEKLYCIAAFCSMWGSPPRGRGKARLALPHGLPPWITPAWAGKSLLTIPKLTTARDHPRVGGEKSFERYSYITFLGSPPRGRGKGEIESYADECDRITPAWAGKRLKRSHRSGIFISGPIPFHSVLHRPAGSGGSRAGRDGSPAGQPQNAGPA